MQVIAATIILVAILLAPGETQGSQVGGGEDREKMDDFKIVSVEVHTGISGLARWFHQDWKLVYSDVTEAATAYLEGLSDGERESLKSEFDAFLATNRGSGADRLRAAWLELGAGSWPQGGEGEAALAELRRAF